MSKVVQGKPPGEFASFSPMAPPGGLAESEESPAATAPLFWRPWRPGYGIALALLLVAADALLYPGERGLTVGGKILVCIAAAVAVACFTMAWSHVGSGWLTLSTATVAGILVAAFSGDWFGGAPEPPAWRNAIIPAMDVLILAGALITWYAGRRTPATMLLVAGTLATAMIFYGQQTPPKWALLVAVTATFVFLAPGVAAWPRAIGIAAHALAILGLTQGAPTWFAWTPYPFLTMFPAYLLVVYARQPGVARRIAWWLALLVGILVTLLGISTWIGNWRRNLPLRDSQLMLALGLGVLAVFALLAWWARRANPQGVPSPSNA